MFFTPEEFDNIIAFKELLAIFYAIRSLQPFFTGNHIMICSDSVSAIKYVQDMGGMTNLKMDLMARDLWNFAVEHNLWLTCNYVKSAENYADAGSRVLSTRTEWTLLMTTFHQICDWLGTPTIDMFASRLNARLPHYVSWFPDPYCLNVDFPSLGNMNFHIYSHFLYFAQMPSTSLQLQTGSFAHHLPTLAVSTSDSQTSADDNFQDSSSTRKPSTVPALGDHSYSTSIGFNLDSGNSIDFIQSCETTNFLPAIKTILSNALRPATKKSYEAKCQK